MPIPSTPDLQDNGWFPSGIQWAEFISKTGATSQAAFGFDNGIQATMSIQVFWEDHVQAVVDLLGVNETDDSNPSNIVLTRTLPMQHPVYPQLWAERITGVQPVNFQEKIQAPVAPISRYDFVVLTVQFVQPKYFLLTDTELDNIYGTPRHEWQRFIETVPQPASFQLSRSAADWKWAETSGTGPVIGDLLKNSVPQYLSQLDYTLVWKRVPYDGLFSSLTGRPDNLLAALNKVNSSTFLNFTAGTLLFKAFRLTMIEDPVDPFFINATDQAGRSLLVDVELGFSYFSPPAGATLRGWGLQPWNDNKWYGIQSVSGSNPLIPSADFTTIFAMQS